jgi:hypothetical protein
MTASTELIIHSQSESEIVNDGKNLMAWPLGPAT